MNPIPHASTSPLSPGQHSQHDQHSRHAQLDAASRHTPTAGLQPGPFKPSDAYTGTDVTMTEARSFTRLNLSPVATHLPLEQRAGEARRLAIEAFPQCDNWVLFYREIFGVDGVVRKLYTTLDELKTWETTPEFYELHTMLAALRSQDNGKGDTIEPQRMITVRLPVSMHEAMKLESLEVGLSINKLCITKMLQKLDPRFAPQEPGKRRGRKPGPQGKRPAKTVD